MAKLLVTESQKSVLHSFLVENPFAELVNVYLFFIGKKYNIQPVIFLRDKLMYRSEVELINKIEKEGKIWREAEVKIDYGSPSVNEHTTRIYICPFTGKVFGNNTHPNP